MTGKLSIAVIYGGQSSEHAVSCVSAGNIIANIDTDRFDIIPIGITPTGRWVKVPLEEQVTAFTADSVIAVSEDHPPVRIVSRNRFAPWEDPLAVAVDVAFPVIHGPYGEDGSLQGYLELAGIAYVGSGIFASAASMDKEMTKKLLLQAGLPVGPFITLKSGVKQIAHDQLQALNVPLFVKPARGGSSVGVTKVNDYSEVWPAVIEARRWDQKVIIEAGIMGREIEISVLEFPDGTVRASMASEIAMPSAEVFYDYQSKYLADVASITTPADLTDDQYQRLSELALQVFDAVNAQGYARVDFFLQDDHWIVNEINTIPGNTPSSQYPRMWEASGIDYPTLINTMIDTALQQGTGLR